MKKNGFTLAEVLITLAIIGVVATLTLPSLMSNTAEQQALTSYKKIINTLTEAGQLNSAMEGFDYTAATAAGAFADNADAGSSTLSAIINARTQVNRQTAGAVYNTTTGSNHCNVAPVFTLRDGTGICIGGATVATANRPFALIWVDTNGPKAPNRESTCTTEGCTDRSGKQIYDQFPVTLYQGTAIPGHWTAVNTDGATASDRAARYAMGVSQR